MVIQTVEIQNFRGIYGTKKFTFEGKSFVLLAAPNGLGKTTLIDAIEWCLTGNISRLKHAFDTRSTNDEERKSNVDGIIKNKKAFDRAEISVTLEIREAEACYKIKRVQKKDELDAKLSTATINGDEELAKELLPKIADRNFYNFHFCDVQKSIEMQSRKRKDLPDLFSEFITDYTREICIAENLELFAEDAKRYKEDLEGSRITVEKIDSWKRELDQISDSSAIQNYPEIKIYAEEVVLPLSLDESGLRNQLSILHKCAYSQAEKELKDILNDRKIRNIGNNLNGLLDILNKKKEEINQVVALGLHADSQKIDNLEQQIKKYKEIDLTKDNFWSNTDTIIAIKSSDFTEEKCSGAKSEIQKLERDLDSVKSEIETLSKGNTVLDALTSLLSQEQGLIQYRDEKQQSGESVKCPVCGSERFGQIEQEQILEEAKVYQNQHGTLLVNKKIYRDQLASQIDFTYEMLIKTCNQILTEEIQKDERKKEEWIGLQKETEEFFSVVKRLESADSQKYKLEQLLISENVVLAIKELEEKYLSEDDVVQKRVTYKKILDLIEYKVWEEETEEALAQKMHELANGAPEMTDFSHPLLVRKIVSLNSILHNKRCLELKHELHNAEERNADITRQQNELDNLADQAEKRAGIIQSLVNQSQSEEYSNVHSNLYKFYKKLSRINTVEGIQLKQENDLLSIVDERNKNVVNILSNGQLSVFMLAYFFAGIVSRNSQEQCKIYFIDDLTACMDDVNMLAFLDLIKYQLLAKDGTMDQIFFASCDERVCNLLRYKLDGCDIDYRELKEREFA